MATKKIKSKLTDKLPAMNFVPPDQASHKQIVGYLKIPLRATMLKGWKSGSMLMSWADCLITATDNKGNKFAEVGGGFSGTMEFNFGDMRFFCSGKDVLNALFQFVNDHPEYRDWNGGKVPYFDTEKKE